MKTMKRILVATMVLEAAACGSAAEPGSFEKQAAKVSWAVEADPALPNVLILGDSISIGYTLDVRKLLKGRANVFRPVKDNGTKPENCSKSTFGIESIDRWLALAPKWDVIHFNWGLHDLARINRETGQTGPEVPPQISVEEYKVNLRKLVAAMKATGAKLIFATTTTFPPGVTPCRLPEEVEKYNAAAREIMDENGVLIDDLHALTKDRLSELQLPLNVHFTGKGSRVIAEKVAGCIESTLPAKK